LIAACSPEVENSTITAGPALSRTRVNPETEAALLAQLDATNQALAARGVGYRAALADYLTPTGSGELGSTVITRSLGNKRLPHDFVPFDSRRADWSGTGADDDITFAIDQTGDAVPPSTAVEPITAAQTTAAIRSAMATWDNLTCTTLPLVETSAGTTDLGVFAFEVTGGARGSETIVADIQHAGWRDVNFAGGILGVTITYIFLNDDGSETDIDGNGLPDVAFREIYYDPSWIWRVNGGDIDVETVAVHEVGHGLSQAHFGTIFERSDGTVDASPRAVMNALYQEPLRVLLGTDDAGHCGNWGNWPNS
jgi:hypothetical protein